MTSDRWCGSGTGGSGAEIIVECRFFQPPALVTPCVWTAMIAPLSKRQCTPLPSNYRPGKRMWNSISADSRHHTTQQPADGRDWVGWRASSWLPKWITITQKQKAFHVKNKLKKQNLSVCRTITIQNHLLLGASVFPLHKHSTLL